GDVFSVRIAGNVAKEKVMGSIEYSCAVAGAKLIVVMGHTSCGAVTTAVNTHDNPDVIEQTTGCSHIKVLLEAIQKSIDPSVAIPEDPALRSQYIDQVAKRHVENTIKSVVERSSALSQLIKDGKIAIVGAMYDVNTGNV